MIRGIVTGGFWGLVTVTAVLSVASLLAPQPAGNRPPETPQVEVPATDTGAAIVMAAPEVPSVEPEASEDEPAPAAPAPVPNAENAEDNLTGALADTATAAQPETTLTTEEPVPLLPGDAPAPPTGPDAPIGLAPQSAAPQVPTRDADLNVSTDSGMPVKLPAAAVADVAMPPADTADAEPVTGPEASSDLQPSEVPENGAVLPRSPTVDAVEMPVLPNADAEIAEPRSDAPPVVSDGAAGVPAVMPSTDAMPAASMEVTDGGAVPALPIDQAAPVPGPDATAGDEPVVNAQPADSDVLGPPVITVPAIDVEPAAPAQPADLAEAETTPETALPRDTQAEPSVPAMVALEGPEAAMPSSDDGVRINRPDAEAEAVPEVEIAAPDSATTGDAMEVPSPDQSALERFATPLENTDGKPVLGIILIDTGELNNAVDVLAALPFPVTVALDPVADGAAAANAAYRAAGIEVMALARLPRGARPTDVEVNFEVAFGVLPEAIGVLDAGEGGLQSDSAVTDQAMARLVLEGRGVVTLSTGLNMAARAAADAGVPAATVFRDLDGNGQDALTIRRYLDQAALRARQTSGVVLLGRIRPDTLSALMLWGAEARAAQVAAGPVSAVLLAR